MAQAETSGSLVTAVADVRCESEHEAMPFDVKLFFYLFKAMAQEKPEEGGKKKQSVLYLCHLAMLLTAWG